MCGRLGSPRVAWGCLLGAPRQVKENHQPHLSGGLWTKPPSAISLGRGSFGSIPVLLLQGSQGLSSLGLCSQRQLWGGHHGPNITQPGQGGPPTLKAGVLGAQLDVEAAHSEILKYFQSVTSNRWLMVKIFLILIVFFIIFVVFLA